jgi:hypothetical protein
MLMILGAHQVPDVDGLGVHHGPLPLAIGIAINLLPRNEPKKAL